MFSILITIQVLIGLAIIGLVLLQQGKGADMGAAFGSGASGTVFGAKGGGSFFTRMTGILATAFFINSALLSSSLVLDRDGAASSITDNGLLEGAMQDATLDSVVTDLPPADLSPAIDTGDLPPSDLPVLNEAVELPATETIQLEQEFPVK
ncbi:MAG: preprotein translocase subunit SecG [Gammaproteobacteria bacterium]